jgi:exosortase/archaeosortase family protein
LGRNEIFLRIFDDLRLAMAYQVGGMEKDPLSGWYQSKRPIFIFSIKFGALMLGYYGVSMTPFFEQTFWPANLRANAWLANVILHGLHQHTQLAEATILTGSTSFVIKRGCDATEPIWLLIASVIAFPAPFFRQLAGIVVGALLVQVLNQMRIVCLFFVGRDHPGLYHSLHLTVFPAIFVVLAMLIWFVWVKWVVEHKPLKCQNSSPS